jgi:aspartyl/asparaginyl-tRNA synthetase
LKTLERDTTVLEAISAPFPRLHYDDAVEMLQQGMSKGELENNFEWGGDFGAPDETYLSNQFGKPVFVHHFPARIKGFYFEVDKDDPKYALGIDLLHPKVTARSSAAANVLRHSNISKSSSKLTTCRANHSNGISIFDDTARSRTADSAWASNAAPRGCAASST